jgi:hypothetical protein
MMVLKYKYMLSLNRVTHFMHPRSLLFILLIAIFLGAIVRSAYTTTEPFQTVDRFRFLGARETYVMIAEDKDGYIQNMDSHMLSDRGFSRPDDYKTSASLTALSFNQVDIYNIVVLAKFIDAFTAKYYQVDPKAVPWTFALTEGQVYERGQPHVRQNTIFLSSTLLENEALDSCQMGWTLLYLRLQLLFGNETPNGTNMPWSSSDVFKRLKSYGYVPTCKAFARASLIA